MALTIFRNDNTFILDGKINAMTARRFEKHVNTTFKTIKNLTIDISKVTEIDTKGVAALMVIYKKAKTENKTFSIVGSGCKDIYEELLTMNIA